MNNRNNGTISKRIKRAASSRYSSLHIADLGLPADQDINSYPFKKWNEEFFRLSGNDTQEGAIPQLKWVNDKMRKLGLNFETISSPFGSRKPKESNLQTSTFSAMSFVDDKERPSVLYVVPVHEIEMESGHRFNYASAVVQLLMMGLKLKNTDDYVNSHIVFCDVDDRAYASNHLLQFIEQDTFDTTVAGIIVPAMFIGSAINIKSPIAGIIENVFQKLMKEYGLDWSLDIPETNGFISNPHDLISEFLNEVVSIGFGPPGDTELSEIKEKDLRQEQLSFVATEAFKTLNALMYQSAIICSDWYRFNNPENN